MVSEMAHGASDQPQAGSARQRFIDAHMQEFPQAWRDRMPHTSDPSSLLAAFKGLLREYMEEDARRQMTERERK
jgi:hypothetical protein